MLLILSLISSYIVQTYPHYHKYTAFSLFNKHTFILILANSLLTLLFPPTFSYIICSFYIASIIDYQVGEIPDICHLLILFFSIPKNFYFALSILAIGLFLSHLQIIGFGDIKLLSVLSLHLSYTSFCLGLFLSSILALIYQRQRIIRFAPYISVGFLLVLLLYQT